MSNIEPYLSFDFSDALHFLERGFCIRKGAYKGRIYELERGKNHPILVEHLHDGSPIFIYKKVFWRPELDDLLYKKWQVHFPESKVLIRHDGLGYEMAMSFVKTGQFIAESELIDFVRIVWGNGSGVIVDCDFNPRVYSLESTNLHLEKWRVFQLDLITLKQLAIKRANNNFQVKYI